MKPSELWTLILSALIGVGIAVALGLKQPSLPAPLPLPKPAPVPVVVKWQAASYEESLQLSQAHGRRVVCLFSAKWCPACVRLEGTLRHANVLQKLAGECIYVKVDADARRDLGRRYGISGVPTLLQLDSAGAELRRHVGYMPADEFVGWLGAMD